MLPVDVRRPLLVGLLAIVSGAVAATECCLALIQLNELYHRRRKHSIARLFFMERQFNTSGRVSDKEEAAIMLD